MRQGAKKPQQSSWAAGSLGSLGPCDCFVLFVSLLSCGPKAAHSVHWAEAEVAGNKQNLFFLNGVSTEYPASGGVSASVNKFPLLHLWHNMHTLEAVTQCSAHKAHTRALQGRSEHVDSGTTWMPTQPLASMCIAFQGQGHDRNPQKKNNGNYMPKLFYCFDIAFNRKFW